MNSKLLKETDSRVWVYEWLKEYKNNPEIASDPATMFEWFANAMLVGAEDARNNLWEFHKLQGNINSITVKSEV